MIIKKWKDPSVARAVLGTCLYFANRWTSIMRNCVIVITLLISSYQSISTYCYAISINNRSCPSIAMTTLITCNTITVDWSICTTTLSTTTEMQKYICKDRSIPNNLGCSSTKFQLNICLYFIDVKLIDIFIHRHFICCDDSKWCRIKKYFNFRFWVIIIVFSSIPIKFKIIFS